MKLGAGAVFIRSEKIALVPLRVRSKPGASLQYAGEVRVCFPPPIGGSLLLILAGFGADQEIPQSSVFEINEIACGVEFVARANAGASIDGLILIWSQQLA